MRRVVVTLDRRKPCPRLARGPQCQRGVTLVEWMISITIGLILVAGLSLLFAQQSSTQSELERSSRQIENGRYAMQLLRDDIQLAGYDGEFGGDVTTTSSSLPLIAPQPCATDIVGPGSFPTFPVQGYDAPTTSLPCGISTANHVSGTDILVVRHADASDNPNGVAVSDIKQGQLYIQTGTKNEMLTYSIAQAVTDGTVPVAFDLLQKDETAGKIRKYLVHVYYISPCSVMANGSTCAATDDGGTPIPTLKRMELTVESGAPSFKSVPLVEGIENMQIDYGLDTVGSDGAPDSYVTSTTDWANVMSLRISLLARNNERSAGYADNKIYNLGLAGATTATNDAFKRHVFSQLVRVVNPSSRRDR